MNGEGKDAFENIKKLIKDLKTQHTTIQYVTGHFEVDPKNKINDNGFPYDKKGVGVVSYWQPTGSHPNASTYTKKKPLIEAELSRKSWATFDAAADGQTENDTKED